MEQEASDRHRLCKTGKCLQLRYRPLNERISSFFDGLNKRFDSIKALDTIKLFCDYFFATLHKLSPVKYIVSNQVTPLYISGCYDANFANRNAPHRKDLPFEHEQHIKIAEQCLKWMNTKIKANVKVHTDTNEYFSSLHTDNNNSLASVRCIEKKKSRSG